MWHMGDGWGWWMVFGWIWAALFWGLIIWGIVTIVDRTGEGAAPREGRERRDVDTEALGILERRFASGEMSAQAFEDARRVLQRHHRE